MVPNLDDGAALEHHDLVGPLHRAQPVRDDEGGAAAASALADEAIERLLHHLLALGVQRLPPPHAISIKV